MAIDWGALHKEAKKRDEELALRISGGKTSNINEIGKTPAQVPKKTQQSIPQIKKTQEPPKKNGGSASTARKGSNNRAAISQKVKDRQLEEVGKNALPKMVYNMSEGFMNAMTLGQVAKETEKDTNPLTQPIREGTSAKIGRFAGEALGYMLPYGAAGKTLTKGAGAVLGTNAGQKVLGRAAASKLGRKVGKETVEEALKGATASVLGDSTIGLVQNTGLALSEGKRGEDLLKDVAINQGVDLALGGAMEALPVASKLLKARKGGKVAEEAVEVLPETKKRIKDDENILSQFTKFAEGKMERHEQFDFGGTPEILTKYGAKELPLKMSQSTLEKIVYPAGYQGIEHGHNLGYEGLHTAIKELETPVMVIKEGPPKKADAGYREGMIVVIRALDAHGDKVMVPLHLDARGNLETINKVASAYGRPNLGYIIENARNEGRIVFEDIKRAGDSPEGWPQLPASGSSSDPMNILYKNKQNVNGQLNPENEPHLPANRQEPSEAYLPRYGEEAWIPDDMAEPKTWADYVDESDLISTRTNNLYGDTVEAAKPVRSSKKAESIQKRRTKDFKKTIKESLGINRYVDDEGMNKQIDDIIERIKEGDVSTADRDALFDEIFMNGVNVDEAYVRQYADLKKHLRSTPLKVDEQTKRNITDYEAFRRSNIGKVRMMDDGHSIDSTYQELMEMYPEIFEAKNTPEEMLERMAEVAQGIHATETKLADIINSPEEYDSIKAAFDEAFAEVARETHLVKRYLETEKAQAAEAGAELIDRIGKLRREAEKVKRDVVLTERDRAIVDNMHKGLFTEADARREPSYTNIMKVYDAEKPLKEAQAALKNMGSQTKAEYYALAEELLENSDNFKEKKVAGGIRYARETMERNFEDIAPDAATAKALKENIAEPVHVHEANANRMKTALRKEVASYGLSTKPEYNIKKIMFDAPGLNEKALDKDVYKVSESTLTQLYGEGIIDEAALEALEADAEKIVTAAGKMRTLYNDLIETANAELVRHGYDPIEYRKDYFPHFEEDAGETVAAKLAKKMGITIQADELPTTLAGLTHNFRPGKKFFRNALSRTGKATEYDAIKGFDIYLEGIADVIYHTEDIQKVRALEDQLRFKYSDEGVKERLQEIFENTELDETEKRNQIEQITKDNPLQKNSNFAVWLRAYGDVLAGKKSLSDRSMEQAIGRTIYSVGRALENRTAANMVSINPGSWITNFIPLVQAGEIKPQNIVKGMAETVQSYIKDDGFRDMSTFITNRRGSDVLWKSTTERVQEFMSKPMELIDNFVSESVTRAKYLEDIEKGVDPAEAIRNADELAAKVIADRSKGAMPTVFNAKNPLSKMFTMFQIEVNNQWSHLLKDIPKTAENKAQLAAMLTNFAVASYILNDTYEKVMGRRPAMDPLNWVNEFAGATAGYEMNNLWDIMEGLKEGELNPTKETEKSGAVTNFMGSVAQDIPFVGGIMDGGRYPISSALPSPGNIAGAFDKLVDGKPENNKKAAADLLKEAAKPATYILPPFGGGQVKKSLQAIDAIKDKGVYGVDSEGNDKLKFAVGGKEDIAKSMIFGIYGTEGGMNYVDGGFSQLSAKKTAAYKDMVDAGMEVHAAEEFARGLPGTGKAKTANYIKNSELTLEQKKTVSTAMGYGNIDYATDAGFELSLMSDDQQETVEGIKKTGVTTQQALDMYDAYRSADSSTAKAMAVMQEDGYREAVLKALNISDTAAEKGAALMKAGVSVDKFETAKILADKDGNSYIKREEAEYYIDNFCADYPREQKYALLKALTGAKDKNNKYK